MADNQIDEISDEPALSRIQQSRFRIDHVTVQPEIVGGINAGQEAVIRIVPDGDRTK